MYWRPYLHIHLKLAKFQIIKLKFDVCYIFSFRRYTNELQKKPARGLYRSPVTRLVENKCSTYKKGEHLFWNFLASCFFRALSNPQKNHKHFIGDRQQFHSHIKRPLDFCLITFPVYLKTFHIIVFSKN